MKRATSFPLPQPIRQQAAQFFDCNFDDCQVHVSAAPAALGAKAFTDGRDIWIDPAIERLDSYAIRLVYGHELAHIVQQRQGRVTQTSHKQHRGFNDDAHLEREADQLADLFAQGKQGWLSGANLPPVKRPMVQCLVSVGGSSLTDPEALPQAVRQVIELIQGGAAWLKWAIGEGQTQFDFPDALSLVDEIQAGIHGSGLLLLPDLDLLISPLALLAMPDISIEAVEAMSRSNPTNSVVHLEVGNSLANQGFVAQAQLGMVKTFLQQVGLQSQPVFQALNLADSVAIFRAISFVPGSWALNLKVQQEAAVYAADYAVSPQAFADFYQYYLNLFSIPEFREKDRSARASYARQRSDLMAVELRNDLRCPTLVGVPTPAEMKAQMNTWFSRGNRLGFAHISKGIAELSRAANVITAEDAQLSNQIQRYLRSAQKVVQTHTADHPQVAQDGSALFYTFGHTSQKAVLRLERGTGCVTLEALKADVNGTLEDEDPIGIRP